MRRAIISLLAWSATTVATLAQSTVFEGNYRIPSLLQLPEGIAVAFCDYRPKGGDVGQSPTLQNDIVAKVLDKDWGSETTLLRAGTREDGRLFSFGDAATAYDAATGRILLLCAYGDVAYWNSTLENPIGIHRAYFHLNGDSLVLEHQEDITADFYPIFGGKVVKTFFTSGRICQSKRAFGGNGTRRLYASVASNLGAMVVFSDDFGESWNILGGKEANPAPLGDEAKLAELPNGDVLLSCRARDADGRYLNQFHFTNQEKAEGRWEQPVLSADASTGELHGARCNGELLLVPVRDLKDGRHTHLLLQSLPFGTDRSRVGLYYKEYEEGASKVSDLSTGWKHFEVSTTKSAYSTMADNGRDGIALLYEEDVVETNPDNPNYNIKYLNLTITKITCGEFAYEAR